MIASRNPPGGQGGPPGGPPRRNPNSIRYCICDWDYWSPNETACSLQVGLDEYCGTSDSACIKHSIGYMHCDNATQTCQCSPGHFEWSGPWGNGTRERLNARPGLGERCLNSTACQLNRNNTVCLGGECVCDKKHVDEIGLFKVVNNFQSFAGYKYGQELWYEVVAPHE